MPKTKTPQHPNSRKAWKRSSLKGRLQLMEKVIGNLEHTLRETGVVCVGSKVLWSDVSASIQIIEEQLRDLTEDIDELFELNPIKTKD